jgi:fatty acid desaturase
MEEIFGRASMIGKERLRALSARSDARGWIQTLSHFGAIGTTGTALYFAYGNWWAAPVFVLHGMLINYLYAGQHEFSHSTVFRAKGLNTFFGRLIGFIVLTPRDADQIQHFAHHRFTQQWNADGELFRAPFTLRTYLLRLSGIGYWASSIKALFLCASGIVNEPYLQGEWNPIVIREGRLHLAGHALIAAVSVAAQSWIALTLWLMPMFATKSLHQLQNLIEHVGLPHNGDVTQNTRSVRTNAVMRWMGWNMQYHTAHHAFPSVPCYRLKQLHNEIFAGQAPPTMRYLDFQAKMIAALWKKNEADYPQDRAWIVE